MTDPFDELASAHLDGTTSPEEAARVAADPALQARVEELRTVRAALQALPPVDAARRDIAIAAALAAFAEIEADGVADDSQPARVTALPTAAARRRPSPRVLRLVGAAAAAVLLAALVPLLGRLSSSDDADEATSSQDFEETGGAVGDDDSGAAESAPGAESSAGGATTTLSSGSLSTDLGRFDDLAALEAATIDRVARDDGQPATAFAPADGGDGGDGCLLERAADARAEGATTIDAATATVSGDPVVVLIITDADGARRLQIFLADTCMLRAERSL